MTDDWLESLNEAMEREGVVGTRAAAIQELGRRWTAANNREYEMPASQWGLWALNCALVQYRDDSRKRWAAWRELSRMMTERKRSK